ncbi:enoyl-CoA hydratase/isomerase family protein [Nocardia nova]|uniref:enoyl-CoA hydratase/isomerase family protein n=1 Tax=Nocardia nova TaxID=37330 RepID=UPI00340C9F80
MIATEIVDGIATITIDRPDRLNALTWETMDRLHEAVVRAADADDVTALVLTGAGRAFSSGFDLIAVDTTVDDLGATIEHQMRANLNPLCQAILNAPVPIVAAVNGPCAGGGLGIALLADVTIAAKSAYFLVPQVKSLAIAPDAGATWVLARHVGRARALGMSLTGARISAERAERWGLIWECVEDAELASVARELAANISSTPAASVATRALIDAAFSETPASILDGEARAQRALFRNPAVAERIRQFAQK